MSQGIIRPTTEIPQTNVMTGGFTPLPKSQINPITNTRISGRLPGHTTATIITAEGNPGLSLRERTEVVLDKWDTILEMFERFKPERQLVKRADPSMLPEDMYSVEVMPVRCTSCGKVFKQNSILEHLEYRFVNMVGDPSVPLNDEAIVEYLKNRAINNAVRKLM